MLRETCKDRAAPDSIAGFWIPCRYCSLKQPSMSSHFYRHRATTECCLLIGYPSVTPAKENTTGDVVESEIGQPKNRECSSDSSPYHTNHPSLHLTSFIFEVFKHLLQLLRQWSLNLKNLTSCVQQGNAAAVEEEP